MNAAADGDALGVDHRAQFRFLQRDFEREQHVLGPFERNLRHVFVFAAEIEERVAAVVGRHDNVPVARDVLDDAGRLHVDAPESVRK
jgi:predicted LPLAT superfamily acyltransferase